jgi:hypothetical protein
MCDCCGNTCSPAYLCVARVCVRLCACVRVCCQQIELRPAV